MLINFLFDELLNDFDGTDLITYNKYNNKYDFKLRSEEDQIEEDYDRYQFRLHINSDSSPFMFINLNIDEIKLSIEDLNIEYLELTRQYKTDLMNAFNSCIYESGFNSIICERFTYALFHMIYVNGNPTYSIDTDTFCNIGDIEVPKAIEPVKDPRQDVRTKAWIGAVKLRDEFKCRRCGSNERLNAHHIIPICSEPDLAFDINNGISLCEKCHIEFHSKYGNSNIGHFECYEFIRGVENSEHGENGAT